MIENFKNLFLIFPFGCGGNHLANMLSMTPGFTKRIVTDDYVQSMYRMYTELGRVVFHHSDVQNLQPKELRLYGERYLNSDLKNIWCAHHNEYIHAIRAKDSYPIVPFLDDKVYCLFTKPSVGSIAFDRQYFGPWPKRTKSSPMLIENPKYYTKEHFCTPPAIGVDEQIDPDRVFVMDSEKFFLSYDYLSTTIFENLNIELPEICRLMHHLWLERQKHEIEKNKLDFNSVYYYNIVDTVSLKPTEEQKWQLASPKSPEIIS